MDHKKIGSRTFPFSDLYRHDAKAVRDHREYMLQKNVDDFYWKAFSILRFNKVAGDYLEFGCGSNIRSFRFALKYNRYEPFEDRRLFAFDSFAGLPEVGPDDHSQWRTGAMAVSLEQFREVLAHYDAADGHDYRTVPGFYDRTLSGHAPATYGIEKAAFVHVDCDLYASTVPVLEFVTDILQPGSILSFDDWFCENGDPRRGEQRAFHEWRAGRARKWRFDPYLSFGWHGMSFLVNPAEV